MFSTMLKAKGKNICQHSAVAANLLLSVNCMLKTFSAIAQQSPGVIFLGRCCHPGANGAEGAGPGAAPLQGREPRLTILPIS
jgi:hypothetical protein